MSRGRFTHEVRQHVLELAASGRSVKELALEYGMSENTIYKWQQMAATATKASGSTPRERELERENEELRKDLAILKKAAAWFAKDSLDHRKG